MHGLNHFTRQLDLPQYTLCANLITETKIDNAGGMSMARVTYYTLAFFWIVGETLVKAAYWLLYRGLLLQLVLPSLAIILYVFWLAGSAIIGGLLLVVIWALVQSAALLMRQVNPRRIFRRTPPDAKRAAIRNRLKTDGGRGRQSHRDDADYWAAVNSPQKDW